MTQNLLPPRVELKMVKDTTVTYNYQITCPDDIYKVLKSFLEDQPQEMLVVIPVDTKNKILGMVVVYQGNVNTSIVRVSEVIRPAILMNATAFAIAHNHPSGDSTPSPEDVQMTRTIKEAGDLMGIELLDSVIVGFERYTSLKERSLGF